MDNRYNMIEVGYIISNMIFDHLRGFVQTWGDYQQELNGKKHGDRIGRFMQHMTNHMIFGCAWERHTPQMALFHRGNADSPMVIPVMSIPSRLSIALKNDQDPVANDEPSQLGKSVFYLVPLAFQTPVPCFFLIEASWFFWPQCSKDVAFAEKNTSENTQM